MKSEPIPEYGELTGPGELRLVRLLPGPVERVWSYLTEPAKRAKWLAGGPMELRTGGSLTLQWDHAKITPHREDVPEKYREMCASGATTTGKVTRCDPPAVLAYTWDEGGGIFSEVTFELSAKGDHTILVTTHRKLGSREMLLSVAAGWHTHFGILEDVMTGRTPRPFWSNHSRLEEEYARRLPLAAIS